MCGIAGIVRLDGAHLSGDSDVPLLRSMTRQVAHRGPDDEQVFVWGNVGLGFRRLSIVDPTDGQQPLFNEDHTVALICNGEIYNHRDLQVSLRRWPSLQDRIRLRDHCPSLRADGNDTSWLN